MVSFLELLIISGVGLDGWQGLDRLAGLTGKLLSKAVFEGGFS